MKLSDRRFVEGFANRIKDPLIRVPDRCHKSLVRLAVDVENARLAAVAGPPPMRLVVEHGAERDSDEVRVPSDAAGQQVVQDSAINVIWHGARSARLALKSEWLHVAEFLIAQHCRHSRRCDTGLDRVEVAEVLRAERVDVGYFRTPGLSITARPSFRALDIGKNRISI